MGTILRNTALLLALGLAALGCSSTKGSDTAATTGDTTTTAVATTTAATPGPSVVDAACAGAVGLAERVAVRARPIVEASGLAVSRNHEGVLWTHNDSGDTARVFALGDDGHRLGTFSLTGAQATDWEDMAIGPHPDGEDALYLADIGDNDAVRPSVTIYRVPEPGVSAGAPPVKADLDGVEAYPFHYPDGPRDSEALFIDRTTDSFYVIEKSLEGGPVGVYRGPLDGWTSAGNLPLFSIERVGTLTLGAGPANAVTGADMTPSGEAIAVRTYGGVLLWERPDGADGADVVDVLAEAPCQGPLPAEVQGEAIALAPDASAYVTLPEGESPSLSFWAHDPRLPH